MAKKSTGLCTNLLGGASGDTLQNMFALGFLKVYAGTVPATADAAIGSATLLNTYTVDGDGVTGLTFDDPVAGVLSKAAAETWKGTAVANGTATFFRFVPATNTTTLSTTEVRIQGIVGIGGAVDMILGSTAFTVGADYTVPVFNVYLTPT